MLEPIDVLRLYPPHDGTLGGLLRSRAAAAPQREFVVFRGASCSYRQALDRVQAAAAWLEQRGVGPGDRVAVMSANHPSTVFLLLALAARGAAMVAVNPDFGVEEARYVLTHGQVRGVVCAPDVAPTVAAATARLEPPPWIVGNDTLDFAQPRAPAAADPADAAEAADAVCVLIYTSGTTGFPKGVMHSQRNLVLAGEGFVARMALQPDDRLLCVLPMFHVNAICYSLCGALAAGATLILEPRFSASTFWRTVKDSGATEVNTIAAVSSILMRRPRSEYVGGHRLVKIYGAPFDEETYRVFRGEFSVPTLIEGYGMTEVPGALNNPFGGPHKVRCMGRPSRHPDPALPFAEVRVADDDGRTLPDGEVGELLVRTPIAMKGYFRDPEQTAAAFRDGWFRTGDLARRDADGDFWFVARRKDIIRCRGENVSGAEVDAVVQSHPQVMLAAAIPVPSPLGEDDILVAIVPRPGAELSAGEIGRWCRSRLAPVKVPRWVVLADALPMTPTHRVAKFRLREDAALLARAVEVTAA